MSAIEIEFVKNKSRFKTLHYEDHVRLMKEYKKYGTYPFEQMNKTQRNDFRHMACCYEYVEKGDKLLKNIITKKKKGLDNESEYLKS